MTRSLLIDVPLFGMFWAYLVFVLPAAVVCVLKRRWLLFAVGLLTFGITWFIGALGTAANDSWWHLRFNAADPDPESRAFEVLQGRRRNRIALMAVAAVVVFGLAAARPVPIVGVDGESLQSSVGGIVALTDTCEELPGGDWRCYAYDDSVSGDVAYRVKVGPLGCWKARAIDNGATKPAMTGCLTFFHTGFSIASISLE